MTSVKEDELRGFILAFFSPVFFAVAGLGMDLRTLLDPTLLFFSVAVIAVARVGWASTACLDPLGLQHFHVRWPLKQWGNFLFVREIRRSFQKGVSCLGAAVNLEGADPIGFATERIDIEFVPGIGFDGRLHVFLPELLDRVARARLGAVLQEKCVFRHDVSIYREWENLRVSKLQVLPSEIWL